MTRLCPSPTALTDYSWQVTVGLLSIAPQARNLRLLCVEANATERAGVRGEGVKSSKVGIYRARLRGDSIHVRAQAEAVAPELLKGNSRVEPGKRALVETRRQVERGWRTLADNLAKDGHTDLAR